MYLQGNASSILLARKLSSWAERSWIGVVAGPPAPWGVGWLWAAEAPEGKLVRNKITDSPGGSSMAAVEANAPAP